jgi:hypothetical protein
MKRRYIICVNNSNVEQQKKFIEFLTRPSVGYWHWLSNTWLVVVENDALSMQQLMDTSKTLFDNEYSLVIEINNNGDTWTGYGPNGVEKNMFTWLINNWKK